MQNHFKIIVPMYNVEKWISTNIKSVLKQEYTNFQCIIVDDESSDSSYDVVNNLIKDDKRFVLTKNEIRLGALHNIVNAINISNPNDEDIIITLDGDDWLSTSSVLNKLNDLYQKNDIYLTYGTYVEFPTGVVPQTLHNFPEQVKKDRSFREYPWMATHLRTFKYKLWKNLDNKDLMDENQKYYMMTWDLAMMFPMLEMAPTKNMYVPDVLYVYNKSNPLNDDKVNHHYQLSLEVQIRNKPKKQQLY